MKCRQCGTDIAERALICYRCGTATVEAKYKAPPARQPRRIRPAALWAALVAVLLALLGFLASGGW